MADLNGTWVRRWCARLCLLLCCGALSRTAFGTITTNVALWQQLDGWRAQVAGGAAAQVVADIDMLAAGGAPWRALVVRGDDWEYSWGFLALNTYAWACMRMHDPVRAYRALENARAYLPAHPPPAPRAYHYWRWHVSMGELCARFGRLQDARWYFAHTRSHLSTNDGLYFKATAELAPIMARHDDPAAACALYDELLNGRRWQPTRVWHYYIQLLFACGRDEEGVAAILRGAHANGFSARHVERDYFIIDACRYWHFFRELDIIEWYDFLGDKLARIRVKPANQALITLLINTRTLMQQAHPDLLALPAEDVRALGERLRREQHRHRASKPGHAPSAPGAKAQSQPPPINMLTCSVTAGPQAATNAVLEDTVNRILLDAARVAKYTYGAPEPWLHLLKTYDTNALATVLIDGAPVQWLARASLAAIFSDRHNAVAATNWQAQALDTIHGVNNPVRLAELCLWIAHTHLSPAIRNLERAEHFARWALDVAPHTTRLYFDAQDKLAGVALLKGTPHDRIAILRGIVAQGGCMPRQAVYERLERDYFRTAQPREAVATLFEGMRRCLFKLEGGRFNHFIETLRCARSVLTAAEIEQLRALLRSGAMRYPATLDHVAVSGKALALAQVPWFEQELRLARIQEAGVFSEVDWLIISNSVTRRPGARAGRLWINAQVAHATIATNAFNWSGWVAGWNAIPKECEGPASLGDTGLRNFLYADLLSVLEHYTQHVDRTSTVPGTINCALLHLLSVPHAGELYARACRIVEQWGNYDQFDFSVRSVCSKVTLEADDVDLARLRRLQPKIDERWWDIWRDPLRMHANADSAGSNQWAEILNMIPATLPAPPRP